MSTTKAAIGSEIVNFYDVIKPKKHRNREKHEQDSDSIKKEQNGHSEIAEADFPIKSKQSKLELLIPNEILELIFGHLKLSDGVGLFRTSKLIREIVCADRFEWADGRRLDFCLMVDATYSMRPIIENVQSTLKNIIETIRQHELIQKTGEQDLKKRREKFHLRTGLIDFRDYDANVHSSVKNFTSNSEEIIKYISGIKTESGHNADWAEDIVGALFRANTELCWTSNPSCRAVRVLNMVFDTAPHGMGINIGNDKHPLGPPASHSLGVTIAALKKQFKNGKHAIHPMVDILENNDWLKLAYDFKKKGIIINAILCNEEDEISNLFGTTIAKITGGKCLRLNDASALGHYLVAQACAELELDEFLTLELAKELKRSSEIAKTSAEVAHDIDETPAEAMNRTMSEAMEEDISREDAILERVLTTVVESQDMIIPMEDPKFLKTVEDPRSEALSQCRSIKDARKFGLLPSVIDPYARLKIQTASHLPAPSRTEQVGHETRDAEGHQIELPVMSVTKIPVMDRSQTIGSETDTAMPALKRTVSDASYRYALARKLLNATASGSFDTVEKSERLERLDKEVQYGSSAHSPADLSLKDDDILGDRKADIRGYYAWRTQSLVKVT